MVANSLEPQFIAGVAVLRTELELRERNVEAARAIADDGLDKIQFCTEDGTRIAKIAAAATSVEAAAAQLARDVGDPEAERAAAERAQMLVALTEASVEDWSGPVERALLDGVRAEAAEAAGDPEAADLWLTAAASWTLAVRPYEEARARLRAAEALVGRRPRGAPARELEAAHGAATRLGVAMARRGGRGARRAGPDPARGTPDAALAAETATPATPATASASRRASARS